ncbi:MAG: TonB family protein [Bacteroidota bacterium]
MKAKPHLAILLLLALASCTVPNYTSTTNNRLRQQAAQKQNKEFEELYQDSLEQGAELVYAAYHYFIQRTAEGSYLYKRYYVPSRILVEKITYSDKERKIKEGPSIEWYEDGLLAEQGQYRNNKKEGLWKNYKRGEGHLDSYGEYQNGVPTGKWTYLYPSGKVKEEANYEDGKRNGHVLYYDEAGTLVKKSLFENGKYISHEQLVPQPEEEKESFQVVEQMPRFKSVECAGLEEKALKACANKAMLVHIYGNIRYPEFARKYRIEGTCVIRFTIDKQGKIKDILPLRTLSEDLREECIRVVREMPDWEPGRANGEPVNVYFNLPIKFRLE